jgi:predicted nuclease of restriction endonuclease-like RecB superfamily
MTYLATLDDSDLPWIASVIDVIERASGKPWRVALDQLDRSSIAGHELHAVIGAIQQLEGGRARNAPFARRARGMVLGAPVFDGTARTARIETAAQVLGVSAAKLELLLWSDLPRERAIELPSGRPSELEVAATANIELVQRALRKAQTIRIRLWGDDGSVLRAANARGLLSTASVGTAGETVLDIVGPLALCHRTSVYSRALSRLVPLLAAAARFELEIHAETKFSAYTLELGSPVLLPLAPFDRSGTSIASRLARELAAFDPALQVVRSPPPIATGSWLSCPDLAIDVGAVRWYVEIVGFWTAEFLASKLARYREGGITHVVLCIDESRGCADDTVPSDALGFTKHVDAEQVLGVMRDQSVD